MPTKGIDISEPFNKIPARVLADPRHFFSLGFGAGLSPVAPGTVGTLVAVPFALMLLFAPLWVTAIVASLAFLAGIPLCGASAKSLGVHDHPAIVWDEIAAFLFLPLVLPPEPIWLVPAFLLFRFFDIVKPWPIRDLDHRLDGGLGIMLDDLVAAIFAAVCLAGLRWLVNWV